MCQIWKDDLSEFKTEKDELEKINNYLLIYKFYSKYEHLIDKVCLIQNNYIITPENNYFNITSGKVTATSSLRHYFDKAPLNIPTVQADWKALTNTTVPAPIPEPVKISKSFEELIIKAGELAKEKQTITERLNEINLQMDKILKEISLCK